MTEPEDLDEAIDQRLAGGAWPTPRPPEADVVDALRQVSPEEWPATSRQRKVLVKHPDCIVPASWLETVDDVREDPSFPPDYWIIEYPDMEPRVATQTPHTDPFGRCLACPLEASQMDHDLAMILQEGG